MWDWIRVRANHPDRPFFFISVFFLFFSFFFSSILLSRTICLTVFLFCFPHLFCGCRILSSLLVQVGTMVVFFNKVIDRSLANLGSRAPVLPANLGLLFLHISLEAKTKCLFVIIYLYKRRDEQVRRFHQEGFRVASLNGSNNEEITP